MGSVFKRASKNMVWGMLNKIIIMVFPFWTRTIMIYKLGNIYIGLDSLFTSILQVLCLADLGMESAVVFSLYEPLAKGDLSAVGGILSFYKRVYRWIGMAIFLLGMMLLPFLEGLIKGDHPHDINIYVIYLLQLCNVALGYWLYAYKNALLVALQRVDVESRIRLAVNVAQYIVQVMILRYYADYYLYVLAFPLFTILQNLVRSHIVEHQYAQFFAKGEIKNDEKQLILSKVKALFIYKVGGVILRYADQLVISAFLGLAVLGKYANYYYVLSTLIGILGIYYNSVRPIIGNSLVEKERAYNLLFFRKLQDIQMWIVGWWSICLVCLLQDFIALWAGTGYMLDFLSVILLVIYFYLWKIQDNVYIFKEAAGLWDQDKIRPVCSALLNLVLNILLVKRIGLHGVMFSTIIAVLLIDLPWSARVFFREYFKEEEKHYYIGLGKWTVCTVMVGSITYWLCSLIRYTAVRSFMDKAILCAIVPNVLYGAWHSIEMLAMKRGRING